MSHTQPENPPRRSTSIGMLLKRSKSGDLGRGGKKAQALREAELERQRQAASMIPPKLPEFASTSERLSKSFSPELRPDSSMADAPPPRISQEPSRTYVSNVPVPPIPDNINNFDPYARTESMAHRGRYSYASSAVSTINSPRRVRRRKDPTPLNVLVIGNRTAGKTSFLEFLKTALALPPNKRAKKDEGEPRLPASASGNFIPHYLETEVEGERIGLTLWDSEGLEKNVVDLQLREMNAFLESKFEETFAEEMKVVRSPGVQDTHIHAAFLILDPAHLDKNIAASRKAYAAETYHNGASTYTPGALDDDIDLQVLKTLHGKTTVIPVISKADTVTTKHMTVLKKAVWNSIKKANFDPLEALGLDEDNDSVSSSRIAEEDEDIVSEHGRTGSSSSNDGVSSQGRASKPGSPGHKRLSSASILRHKAQEETKDDEVPFLPLSIISPDLYEPEVVGRKFPWGFADPYDEGHCDFLRLKEAVFTEWRAELREASREQWYEGWRTHRLKQRDVSQHRRY